MTCKVYLTTCFLFFTLFLSAQTSLQGKITDAETAEELIGANISISQNGAIKTGVSTDFDGNYSVSLDPGTYDIEVAYIGYQNYKITGIVIYAGKTNTLDVQLGDSGVQLSEVVVTSRRRSRKVKESPMSVSTYQNKQSKNLLTKNIDQLAAQTAGLSSADKGDDVNVRGSRTNGTNYYIDGKKIEGTLSGVSKKAQKGKKAKKRKPNKIQTPKIQVQHSESYAEIKENDFLQASKKPLSTFSVDVDAASYSNLRRYINSGSLPPKNAVRIEEMINYFNYDYPQPKDDTPFSIHTELGQCPWNNENLLLHVGLQGKEIPTSELPPSNIVFLLDVSGSMNNFNKLPLLKSSLKLLVKQLRAADRVAIVVYAGSSGLVLNSTPGNDDIKISEALDRLKAGGSTAGKAGLELAYKVAVDNFIKGGNNRIVLATDGDFNVGQSSDAEMKKLIETNREKGVFISVLGFGMGNYKDSKMETIADNGNGNYAYIDNIDEAKKVLVKEFGGTMHAIAKDVKFQLEFNPAIVSKYRLIGYENRILEEEDFKNDKKDAGDIGSGHSVTALYEIVLKKGKKKSNDLKYQKSELTTIATENNELINLKLRYKLPHHRKSKLIEQAVKNEPVGFDATSNNFKFSTAVVEFGMLLRNSEFKGKTSWQSAIELAKASKGNDPNGYRGEMIGLMESAVGLGKR